MSTRLIIITLVAVLVAATVGPPAAATNGMYLTGYGAEVIGRAGANLAISDRSLAINFNPAGITQLQGRHYTLNLSVLAPDMTFENMANPQTGAESNYFPLPAFAYVRGSKDSNWSWGIGFIAQGGMGAEYTKLNSFFGTQDRIFSEVRFMTLSPTVAYAITDDMSLGATLNIGYGDVAFEFFPETSFFNQQNPAFSFFGMDMSDPAGGLQTNLRLGYWWRFHPKWSLGVIYQTETESNFEDADLIVNFEGHPFLQRRVTYSADVEGFTFAAQAGIGFAYRPNDRFTLAVDVKQYAWDDAIDTIEVKATDPDTPGAPDVTVPFVFDWDDQMVYAIGGEYRVNDLWTLRAGYNYGENPVPDDTLNPLFPANVEDHFAFGFGYLRNNVTYDFAIEYAPKVTQTNNNPDPMVNPFGPGTTVTHEQFTVSFGVSWALARKN